MLTTMSSYAQKSYVEVHANYNSDYLSFYGDIPSEICSRLTKRQDNYFTYYYSGNDTAALWYWINLFSSYGYEIEFILGDFDYVLSKPSTSNADAVPRIQMDDEYDGEAKEVARYNLQGIPVKKSEKGVQIIVYSNYTTKTVIVE